MATNATHLHRNIQTCDEARDIAIALDSIIARLRAAGLYKKPQLRVWREGDFIKASILLEEVIAVSTDDQPRNGGNGVSR